MKRAKKYGPALWTLLPGRSRTGGAQEKRARIRPVSKARAKELRQYSKVIEEFLELHPWCEASCSKRSTEVHHTRGRVGPLLCDVRFFMAVCRECHDWIGNNMDAARKLGWLCEKGDWNKPKRP